jgi:hypothetical protein
MTSKRDAADIMKEGGAGAVRARYDEDYAKQKQTNGKTYFRIEDVHGLFQKWFGKEYDTATLDAVLAAAAAEKLPGDPPWLLIISGPGNAKTETVGSLNAIPGTIVVSTIASEGALLSATGKKSRAKAATGGLLRRIGARGTLVIKDFTSILSADRNVRGPMLAALREIHDGLWVRNVGSDGGQTITWEGRLVLVGACTTAWDAAHAVIASMGDRFVTIRSSSRVGRDAAGARAMRNTGAEIAMRKEIATAVAALISTAIAIPRDCTLTEEEGRELLQAANIVTLARTAVETDYAGHVIDAHEPEMPTRFIKQLVQIFRGAVSIGIGREQALALVMRCARDSVPPLRLAVLRDIEANELDDCRVADVARRLQKPWTTVDRTLQALHVLQLLQCVQVDKKDTGDEKKQVRHYTLASGVCLDALKNPNSSPTL